MQGTQVKIVVGSRVWVEEPSVSYVEGQVANIKGDKVEVETSDGKKVYQASDRDLIREI